MKCYVNLNAFKKTLSGKRKKWTTDGKITYCCSFEPTIFIWEKNTKYNHYSGYSGYVPLNSIEII